MTQEELQQLVEKISLESFHRPFLHRALFNTRLRTTGGRYHLSDHHLDFNEKMFLSADKSTIVGIIKHELCHYHLHLQNKGYRHKDQDFKKLLAETGGSRYAPATVGKQLTYQCQQCGQKIKRQRKINTQRYVCGRCRGKLQLLQTDVQPLESVS
ncbi:SprT family protein [Enterococcus massiliensis]|uniref:SprT family protein n=1 Tax=Enterococcus massiliensis TaxID=1640685 RepID=UPI00065E2092|nr:SprT family protein [Enterococcus massiliensis]